MDETKWVTMSIDPMDKMMTPYVGEDGEEWLSPDQIDYVEWLLGRGFLYCFSCKRVRDKQKHCPHCGRELQKDI